MDICNYSRVCWNIYFCGYAVFSMQIEDFNNHNVTETSETTKVTRFLMSYMDERILHEIYWHFENSFRVKFLNILYLYL